MRLLEVWVQTPLAGALGWTLLHSLWQGAIVSAALAAVLLALRSPRARYAAACLALLVLLGGFGLTLSHVTPDAGRSLRTATVPAMPIWEPRSGTVAPSPSNSTLAGVVPWLAPFWIAGVWIFYLGQVGAWISVRRLRRRGVCSAPDLWRLELARLSARVRISRPILLLESCLAEVPLVLGHFRPVILMPVGLLSGLPAGQIEAILLHELAHIRRHDCLVNLLQRSIEGLLFYHPAVWWISGVIRAERENCCDDVAVAMSGNAHQYATALAALEQNRWTGRELAVAAVGGNLVKRVRRLLYPRGPAGTWTPLVAAVVFIATAALAVAAWQSEPPRQSSASAQRLAERAESTMYVKWLNEDVVYIITARERAAFQKLTTNPEREKFIEQFWERRNPTPGAAENAFKEEHYRRIAYANERYASSKPGWKNDRGRIYIQYGPPDEIESHPSGGQTEKGTRVMPPFEQWRYRYIQGIGEKVTIMFVDRARTGDYPMEPEGPQGTKIQPPNKP